MVLAEVNFASPVTTALVPTLRPVDAAPSGQDFVDQAVAVRADADVCLAEQDLGLRRLLFDEPLRLLRGRFVAGVVDRHGMAAPGQFSYSPTDIANDPAFAQPQDRVARRDDLFAVLQEAFAKEPWTHWQQKMLKLNG